MLDKYDARGIKFESSETIVWDAPPSVATYLREHDLVRTFGSGHEVKEALREHIDSMLQKRIQRRYSMVSPERHVRNLRTAVPVWTRVEDMRLSISVAKDTMYFEGARWDTSRNEPLIPGDQPVEHYKDGSITTDDNRLRFALSLAEQFEQFRDVMNEIGEDETRIAYVPRRETIESRLERWEPLYENDDFPDWLDLTSIPYPYVSVN